MARRRSRATATGSTTGSTNVPAAWTNTITGADPGFTDFASLDRAPDGRLAAGRRRTRHDGRPAGHRDFPAALHPPGFLPPLRAHAAPGSEWARPLDGALDIGAFEYGAGAADRWWSHATAAARRRARPAVVGTAARVRPRSPAPGRVRLLRRGKRLLVRAGLVAACPAGGSALHGHRVGQRGAASPGPPLAARCAGRTRRASRSRWVARLLPRCAAAASCARPSAQPLSRPAPGPPRRCAAATLRAPRR